ncbi:MAG: hypothetical protein ACTSVI_13495 [Promethearchaeota archaeon]
MNIRLSVTGELQNLMNASTIDLSLSEKSGMTSLKDLLAYLFKIPKNGKKIFRILTGGDDIVDVTRDNLDILSSILILVNDCDYRLIGGIDAPLEDGDKVIILQAIHGG